MPKLKNFFYCSGRAIGTAAICGAIWGVPMLTIDWGKAMVDVLISEKKQEVTYDHGIILGTPFPTSYTNLVLLISSTVGGIGGLVAGIYDIRIRNRRDELSKLENW